MTVTREHTNADHVRLLRCDTCGPPLEEVPWTSDDPNLPAEYDEALIFILNKHRTSTDDPHVGRLIVVEKRAWDMPNIRHTIMDQIWGGSKGFGELDVKYYDVQNQLRSDALTCFSRHGRPKEDCPDWRTEAKRLIPDTKEERRDIGLTVNPRARPHIWLCSMCPVDAYYQKKARGE